MNLIDTGPS